MDSSDVAETTDLTKTLREATYVAIGFGVLGFQRAQVRRRELAKQLESQRPDLGVQLAEVRAQIAELGHDLERRIEPALVEASERVEPLLDQIRQTAVDTAEQLRARLQSSGRQDDT